MAKANTAYKSTVVFSASTLMWRVIVPQDASLVEEGAF